MTNYRTIQLEQSSAKFLFIVFGIWSFIILCRPQDYFHLLESIRPALFFGIVTLVVYFLNVKEDSSLLGSSQFRLYILMIVFLFVGIPFSLYKSLSLKNVLNYAAVSTMLFILFYQLANTEEKLRRLIFTYCFGVSIYALFSLLSGHIIEQRLSFGLMFDPNDIAFYVINFLPFNFLFISKGNGFKRLIVVINIFVGVILILKTGSRGGLLACLSVIAYLFFVRTNTLNITFVKKTIIILIALVALLSFAMNTERYKAIVDVKNDYNVTDEMGRISIWKIGLRMMMENPWTGVGVGCFSEGVGRDREQRGLQSTKWQAPHNSLIQVGAETGVIGLFLFALMSYRVFRITGHVKARSKSENMVRISEMTRAGFIGHCMGAMFLSQAYSFYWIFYIVLSAQLYKIIEKELN